MDTRPIAALLKQLESTSVDVAEICFNDKGEVSRLSLHPKRSKGVEQSAESKPEKKDETPKKKLTAIASLNLPDRRWEGVPSEPARKVG